MSTRSQPGFAVLNRKLAELKPDARNANKGTKRGQEMIENSLRTYGAGRSILLDKHGAIIAGNKTAENAESIGMNDVIVVPTDGTKLVAVQRMDLDLAEPKAKQLAIADNRSSQVSLDWNIDVLKELSSEIDLAPFWNADEIKDLFADDGASDTEYATKVETPIYTPKGDKPEIISLFDKNKCAALIERIDNSTLSSKEKDFLLLAAHRHIIFDYHQIAEFYCHASPEMQTLMEDSALVIIDLKKAIENGYVELTSELNAIFESDKDDEN